MVIGGHSKVRYFLNFALFDSRMNQKMPYTSAKLLTFPSGGRRSYQSTGDTSIILLLTGRRYRQIIESIFIGSTIRRKLKCLRGLPICDDFLNSMGILSLSSLTLQLKQIGVLRKLLNNNSSSLQDSMTSN